MQVGLYLPQDDGMGTQSTTWTTPIIKAWKALSHLLPQLSLGTH